MGHIITFDDNVIGTIDVRSITSLLGVSDETEEAHTFSMTSLSNFMLVGHTLYKSDDLTDCYNEEDDKLQRLSLAYEQLRLMPTLLIQEVASTIQILDISYNEFDNLRFLSEFQCLSSLICDHNSITSSTFIPFLPKLELLWINHCQIQSLYPWARRLQLSCPNLKYLSLMGNPAVPSYINGANFYECLQYRLFMISLFPYLIHLDDMPVTSDQRREAAKVYRKPLMERLMIKTHTTFPECLKQISDSVSEMLASTPSFALPEKNVII